MTHPTTITADPGLPFVDVTRDFDASPAAVFRAHTDPDLYGQWLGPRGTPMHIVALDARAGGRWQYDFEGNGMQMSFFGVFHAVDRDTRLIQTFEFSLAPGQVGLSTSHFDPVDGRTRLSVREVYPSVESRDAALASGMSGGIVEGYERLDELLA
jgi:uncharacterized protein YndB with AHSA1/START domain